MKKISEWHSVVVSMRMYKRALVRSLFMIALLLIAAVSLDTLTGLSRHYGYDVAGRYPELLTVFRAVALLAWFELSVFWIRLTVSPKSDEQAAAQTAIGHAPGASPNQMAAAWIYTLYTAKWAFRIWVIMKLCDWV